MKRRHRLARYNHPNPTTGDYVAVGIGALTLIGLGYWIYSQSQANATTATIYDAHAPDPYPDQSTIYGAHAPDPYPDQYVPANSTVQIPPPTKSGT